MSERTISFIIAAAAVVFNGVVLLASLGSLLLGLALLLFVPSGAAFALMGAAGLAFGSFFLMRVTIPFVRLVRSAEG